ncbi:MAG: hypothetical protein ACLUD4_03150, partial [Thomasclavelia spiroformis]
DNKLQELSLNTIFKLLYSIETKWTDKQREIINYLIFEKVNQTKASIQFNVTPSNIQQILAKSHYYAFKEAFDAVNVIFSEVNHNVRF